MEQSDSYINSHILYSVSETPKNTNRIFSNIKSNLNNNNIKLNKSINNQNLDNNSIKEEDSLYMNTLINICRK